MGQFSVKISTLSGSVLSATLQPDFSGTAAEGHKSSSGDDAGKDVQRIADHGYSPALDGLAREISTGPRDRLAKIVELDPDRAAQVLKQWLNEPSGNVS
jgi:flagellar biosynthesis/type III secretory pathway M-ring protein FliF/YscJ